MLEDTLPDELMSGGTGWGEQIGGNKPPAQGPGPGNQQHPPLMNGGDDSLNHNSMQKIQLQQQIAYCKNPMGQMSLGSKSPNLQAQSNPPNNNMVNNLGVNMPNSMSMPPNNGTPHQQMSAMQGKKF